MKYVIALALTLGFSGTAAAGEFIFGDKVTAPLDPFYARCANTGVVVHKIYDGVGKVFRYQVMFDPSLKGCPKYEWYTAANLIRKKDTK